MTVRLVLVRVTSAKLEVGVQPGQRSELPLCVCLHR